MVISIDVEEKCCLIFNLSRRKIHISESICLSTEGRHSEAAHEKRLLCAQKCTRGGVGWVGHEGVGWGGVGHEGVGWGGVGWGGWVMKGWGGVGCVI